MTVYNGKFEKISQIDGPTPIEELESGSQERLHGLVNQILFS